MTLGKLSLRISAALVVAAGWAAPIHAALVYGTLGVGGGTDSTLVQIDLTTGTTTTIGAVGFFVNGLTWDASTGTLYGSARNDEGLLTINTTTGAGTLVAGGFNSGASGCSDRNVLLTASSVGSLYGWCDPSSDDLMSINKVTGIAALVGESGISTAQHGLAFDVLDDLYLYNFGGDAYSIDTSTGAATGLGNFGVSAHHGDFNPDNNYYYGIDGSLIRVIDIVGGQGLMSTIALDTDSLRTLAFVSGGSVPEPTSLALLGLGLAGLGLSRRKRG
jgi:hypothetical protein